MALHLESLDQQPSDALVTALKQELARHPQVLAGFLFVLAADDGDSFLTLGVRLSGSTDETDRAELRAELTDRMKRLRLDEIPINVLPLTDESLRRILSVATPVFYRSIETLEREDELLAAEVHFNQGNAFDQENKRSQAIKEWEKAIVLDADHAGAHYNLGIAYSEEDKPEMAIRELRQALALDPLDSDATHDLADVLLEENRVDEAINILRQSLSLNPRDRESALELATIYIDNDMLDEAFGALDEAAGALDFDSSMEEDADLWFELGQAYAGQKRSDDAILAYRRAVAANNHAGATTALQRLHVPIEEPPDEEEE